MSTFNANNVKGLDQKFNSFAEAADAYLSQAGIEDDKGFDHNMVVTFCQSLLIESTRFEMSDNLRYHQYFDTTLWLKAFLEKHQFINLDNGRYFKLDNYYRPIALIDVYRNDTHNLNFNFTGDVSLLPELVELVEANVKNDVIEESKPNYVEIVLGSQGMFSQGKEIPVPKTETVSVVRVAEPAYYPYLEGGINALLADFIASDETVLILMGKPGTGKSCGISAGITALNLLPVYAKKTEVVTHEKFVDSLFSYCDQLMEQLEGSKKRERALLFKERTFLDEALPKYFAGLGRNISDGVREKQKDLIPIAVVEDADLLLRPRSEGNEQMQELLNITDGIGSRFNRKVIFTTNLENTDHIDSALLRPGRCYGAFLFKLLSPMEAVEARAVAKLPPFDKVPSEPVSLAEALRAPRKKIFFEDGAPILKNVVSH